MPAGASTAPASRTAAARGPRSGTSRAAWFDRRPEPGGCRRPPPPTTRHRVTRVTASTPPTATKPRRPGPKLCQAPKPSPKGRAASGGEEPEASQTIGSRSIPAKPRRLLVDRSERGLAGSGGRDGAGSSRGGALVTPEGWGAGRGGDVTRGVPSGRSAALPSARRAQPPASDGPAAPVSPLSPV